MKLNKYSFGVGDRFSFQGKAQLKAFILADKKGLKITPVWNKSYREHEIIGSHPDDVRVEAMNAVRDLDWKGDYLVDADHINKVTVSSFIASSDFFTIDITSSIGTDPGKTEINDFIRSCKKYSEGIHIPGINKKYFIGNKFLKETGRKYLKAVREASEVYSLIKVAKGTKGFITEISIDETEYAQTPYELFFILKIIGDFNIPLQTIAPKFSGRFNKGVDYIGDIERFSKEFEEDLLVLEFAIKEFGLPENLKLSIHSGSDKFSIYPVIGRLIRKYNKGIHIKTAGTTWLEEVAGLAASGGKALELVKSIYISALKRIDELTKPYSDVIDIDFNKLPSEETINNWSSSQFVKAIRHDPDDPDYNLNLRQLVHVSYKIAAEMGDEFTDQLQHNAEIIGKFVTENIYDNHFRRLFGI